VREALQRLVQEGLLTSRPHRGVFVPELTDADLADIFLAREAVESASLRRIVAAGRAAEAAEVLMRQVTAMGEAEAAKDWASVVECDMAFHRDLVDCADSFRLSRMYTVLIAETKLCLHMLFGGYRWREGIVEEHARLARILAHGDLGAVLGELRLHLRSPAAAGHEAPARAGKPR
jgi:DNA-binding GntR family transcriptional regulator